MKKNDGFISIQVIILASILIISTNFLDKMSYRNMLLISKERNLLNKKLSYNNEKNFFISEAITKLNNLLENNEEAFKNFEYEKSGKRLSFSLDKNAFILEEKLKNIISKKISYYDYFKENKILKLKKRRFYEFKS